MCKSTHNNGEDICRLTNTVKQLVVSEEVPLIMVNVLLKAGRSTIITRKADLNNSMAANKAKRKRKLNNNTNDKEEATCSKSEAKAKETLISNNNNAEEATTSNASKAGEAATSNDTASEAAPTSNGFNLYGLNPDNIATTI